MPRKEALEQIHFPSSAQHASEAKRRLCFEELFFLQYYMLQRSQQRKTSMPAIALRQAHLLREFYTKHIPFVLTEAQKRVMRDIYKELSSAYQMNRLLQGDVGSGKTIVAWMCMLIAVSSRCQAALMAPTEVLASQHLTVLQHYASSMNIRIGKLSGSTTRRERKGVI